MHLRQNTRRTYTHTHTHTHIVNSLHYAVGMVKSARAVITQHGVWGLFRGVQPAVARAVFNNGLSLATYKPVLRFVHRLFPLKHHTNASQSSSGAPRRLSTDASNHLRRCTPDVAFAQHHVDGSKRLATMYVSKAELKASLWRKVVAAAFTGALSQCIANPVDYMKVCVVVVVSVVLDLSIIHSVLSDKMNSMCVCMCVCRCDCKQTHFSRNVVIAA